VPESAGAWLEDRGDHLILHLYLQPGARKNEIVGPTSEGLLKLRLTAPPVEGQANRALQSFLAETLELKRSQIELLSGEKSRRKRVRVSGISASLCRARLTGA
jgi:uncharacterized protein (TIGR00251 family)